MEDIFLTRDRLGPLSVATGQGSERQQLLSLLFRRLELLGDDLERVFEGCFEAYLRCASFGSVIGNQLAKVTFSIINQCAGNVLVALFSHR